MTSWRGNTSQTGLHYNRYHAINFCNCRQGYGRGLVVEQLLKLTKFKGSIPVERIYFTFFSCVKFVFLLKPPMYVRPIPGFRVCLIVPGLVRRLNAHDVGTM